MSFGVIAEANDLSLKREAVTKENEELKKRMSGVEEMVANLIVDQQAIAMVRHLKVRRRRLEGANKNILFDLLRSRLHDPR